MAGLDRYEVGDLVVDVGTRTVARDQKSLKLGTLTFDVFLAIIEAAPNVVEYDDLVRTVWRGRPVAPETISQRVSMLRKALDESASTPKYFEVVRGKGLRVVANVAQLSTSPSVIDPTRVATPSIAVLPFRNIGGDPAQEYFCDGLVEDIITDLAHIPQLLVISRRSTFAYKGSVTDTREIGSRLHVNYLLKGSVRRSGDRVRVTARLIDCASSENIWSKRFDGSTVDPFALQDDLTEAIVSALDIELISGEMGRQRRQRRQRFTNPESGDILYRGMYEYYKFEKTAGLAARRYFEQLAEMEPNSATGYAWLAYAWEFATIVQWEPAEVGMAMIGENVEKALAIDPGDPLALVSKSFFLSFCREWDGAMEMARKALDMAPFDEAFFALGYAQMLNGDFDESIRNLQSALRLCPIFSVVQLGVLGTAYRNAKLYDKSIETFKRCAEQFPQFIYAHTGMASTYGLMGDLESARREVEIVLDRDPEFSVERFTTPDLYREPSIMQNCAEVLRKAGLS